MKDNRLRMMYKLVIDPMLERLPKKPCNNYKISKFVKNYNNIHISA